MSDAAEIISLPNERRLTFVTFADIEEHPRKDWLVRDFLGTGEMSAIYGMPGTAKSALAGDLGAHVAAGLLWFGRQVSQGAVLYIAAERSTGWRPRTSLANAMVSCGSRTCHDLSVLTFCPRAKRRADVKSQGANESE
jgi:hypothetical protein